MHHFPIRFSLKGFHLFLTLRNAFDKLLYMIFNKKDNILILINLSRASGRNLLLGMHKFASKVPNWQIRIIQAQEVPAQEIATAIQTGQYDGIISSDILALLVEIAVGFTVYCAVIVLLRDSFMTDLLMGKVLKKKRSS